jgi:hypothetical protein
VKRLVCSHRIVFTNTSAKPRPEGSVPVGEAPNFRDFGRVKCLFQRVREEKLREDHKDDLIELPDVLPQRIRAVVRQLT